MWKPLVHTYEPNVGDKLRFAQSNSFVNKETTYEIVKIERHYFEISPSLNEPVIRANNLKKVIRYFDLGYTVRLEIWMAMN